MTATAQEPRVDPVMLRELLELATAKAGQQQLSIKERLDLLILEALFAEGELSEEQQAKLMEPFPPELIGHKPQPWCRACSNNKQQRHCDVHKIIRCQVCRQRITEAHLDLDFVGHAAVTQRLLQSDPKWKWLPVDWKVFNLPDPGRDGMWICLIVHGVARLGIGETEGGQLDGANAIKARLSDAIKNASMRYGVAIQTWSKEDLSAKAEAEAEAANKVATGTTDDGAAPAAAPASDDWRARIQAATTIEQVGALAEEAQKAGLFKGALRSMLATRRKDIEKGAAAAAPEEGTT